MRPLLGGLLLLTAVLRGQVAGAESGQPITLHWLEGDVAGATTIWTADGKRVLGFIAYRQHRVGDTLTVERTAHFSDGSTDTDEATVRVGGRLESISGRSIIRDVKGKALVDVRIDIAGQRLRGFYVDEDRERHEVDDEVDIGPGTYWGPLFNLVVKNFDANATEGRLVIQSVLATPKPRVIDMELTREGTATLRRTGGAVDAHRLVMLPTVNFLIDPILQRLAPKTEFFVTDGAPPALARFDGPRNYAGKVIRIE